MNHKIAAMYHTPDEALEECGVRLVLGHVVAVLPRSGTQERPWVDNGAAVNASMQRAISRSHSADDSPNASLDKELLLGCGRHQQELLFLRSLCLHKQSWAGFHKLAVYRDHQTAFLEIEVLSSMQTPLRIWHELATTGN